MTRTSAKAKKSKQDVIKKKEDAKPLNENQTDSDGAGESTDKENDSTNYDVEKITHTRIFKGKRQYLVRWKGYSEDGDTWENESALQSCKDILDAFKKEHLAEADSEEEDAEENTEEKGKSKGKKVSKNAKKIVKKTSKTVDSDVGSEDEEENSHKKTEEKENSEDEVEEEPEVKGRNKGKKVTKNLKKNIKQKGKGKGKSADSEVGTEEEPEEEESDLASEKNSKKKEPKGKKRKQANEPEKSKAKKSKKDESDDESVTDGKDYEVEKIIEVHTRKDGSREFLIRWKGYKPSEDTWEPEAHLDCQDLIEKFMEKVDKAKEITTKELRQRSETKRFIPVTPRRGNLRNTGIRPCYQESYED